MRSRLHVDDRPGAATPRPAARVPVRPAHAAILDLQRTAGNRAVAALVQGGPTVQRKSDVELLGKVKQSSNKVARNAAIREVLEGLSWSGWDFPKVEKSTGDGCTGSNTISKARLYDVAGSSDQLAMHINFMIAITGMDKQRGRKRGFLNLTPSLLHVTARAKKVQYTCDGGAASIVTAASSIHCGPNNDWNWTDSKADELALKLGVDKSAVQAAVTSAGLQNGQTYMDGARTGLKAQILAVAGAHYPNVDPTIVPGDTTWT